MTKLMIFLSTNSRKLIHKFPLITSQIFTNYFAHRFFCPQKTQKYPDFTSFQRYSAHSVGNIFKFKFVEICG
jgi:hypothetical protein